MLIHSLIGGIGLADGCTTDSESPEPPDPITGEMTGAVRCCSYDGKTCSNNQCLITTYSKAVKKCASYGMRLCTSSEFAENKCCDKGCNFDSELNWYNDKGQ